MRTVKCTIPGFFFLFLSFAILVVCEAATRMHVVYAIQKDGDTKWWDGPGGPTLPKGKGWVGEKRSFTRIVRSRQVKVKGRVTNFGIFQSLYQETWYSKIKNHIQVWYATYQVRLDQLTIGDSRLQNISQAKPEHSKVDTKRITDLCVCNEIHCCVSALFSNIFAYCANLY